MIGVYDVPLVVLSILVAFLGSYAVMDIVSRLLDDDGKQESAVHWSGAVSLLMGITVWSMHFIGMLAFSLPISVTYDIPLTAASFAVACLAAGAAFSLLVCRGITRVRIVASGAVMGTGISAMHYLGTYAMLVRPHPGFHAPHLALSWMIAVAATVAALFLTWSYRNKPQHKGIKLAGAGLMAAAITGMHYVGMAAAVFEVDTVGLPKATGFDSTLMAGTVAAVILIFLAIVLVLRSFRKSGRSSRYGLNLLAVATVLPLLTVMLLFAFYEYQRGRGEAFSQTSAKAHAIVGSLDNRIASVDFVLQTLATSPSLDDGNMQSFYAQATEVMQMAGVNGILLVDRRSNIKLDTRVSPDAKASIISTGRQAIHRVFEYGDSDVTDLARSTVTGEPGLALFVPVRRGGKTILALGAILDPRGLSGLLHAQFTPRDWTTSIFDRNGLVIARNRNLDSWLGKAGPPILLARAGQSKEGTYEGKTLDGTEVVASFARSARTGWLVSVGVPEASFTQHLWNSLWFLLAFTGLSLAISLYLAWSLGRRITASIHALILPAQALGRKETVNVPPLYLQELSQVGRALEEASAVLSQAQHEANHDPLTGLANRAGFSQLLDHQLSARERNGFRLAVLYIDLDGFKAVNDSFGHALGDRLLQSVAARMQACLRMSDIAARLGGDEFAAVLPDIDESGAAAVAEKLVGALSVPFPLGPVTVNISASIGIAVSHSAGESRSHLLQRADDAMYRAKRAGKKQFSLG